MSYIIEDPMYTTRAIPEEFLYWIQITKNSPVGYFKKDEVIRAQTNVVEGKVSGISLLGIFEDRVDGMIAAPIHMSYYKILTEQDVGNIAPELLL